MLLLCFWVSQPPGVTSDPRAQSRLQLTQKDVSGSDGPGKHGEGYKVRSHFGSSLEMVLCLLGPIGRYQLQTASDRGAEGLAELQRLPWASKQEEQEQRRIAGADELARFRRRK